MHTLVKFTSDDRGEKVKKDPWHLSITKMGTNIKLCSGEVYGYGEGAAVFTTKLVEKGGITCPHCLSEIAYLKGIRL